MLLTFNFTDIMLTIRNSYFDKKLLKSHCNYVGKENHLKKNVI